MTTTDYAGWWTVTQACAEWRVTRTTLYRWMREDRIRTETVFGRRVVDPSQARPNVPQGRRKTTTDK